MSCAPSVDLRRRAVASVEEEGLPHRQGAERFNLSAASISRWRTQKRNTGELAPGPLGGDRHSHLVQAHADVIFAIFNSRADMTVEELTAELLAQKGLSFGYGTLWRLFDRHGFTRRKDWPR